MKTALQQSPSGACNDMAMTTFDVVLRLAIGQSVSQAEAVEVLTSGVDRQDAARLERVARIRARNEALRDAAAEMGGPGVLAWALAERLEAAVVRFDARVWPRVKAGYACGLSPSDEALCRAFMTGLRIPKTQRHLYDLLV